MEVFEGKTTIYFDLPAEHGKWIRVLINGDKVDTVYQGWGVLPEDTEPSPIYRVVTDATGLVPVRVDIRDDKGWHKGEEVLLGLDEMGCLVVAHMPAWHVPISRSIGPAKHRFRTGKGALGRWTVCHVYELPHDLFCMGHFACPQSSLVRIAEQPGDSKPNTASIAVVPVATGLYVFRREGKTIRGTIE